MEKEVLILGKAQRTPLERSTGKLSMGAIAARAPVGTSSLSPRVAQSHGEGQETLARAHRQHLWTLPTDPTPSSPFLRAIAQ